MTMKPTFLLLILHTIQLIHPRPKVRRVPPKRNLQRRQELVHPSQQRLWWSSSSSNGWSTLEHNNPIRQVRSHDEIVLNNKRSLLRVKDESFDNFTGNDTLFGIQETRFKKKAEESD